MSAIVFTSSAQAGSCQGPSGAGAIAQYCESVPSGSGGNVQPGNDASDTGKSSLSSKTQRNLRSAGDDGAAIERLADAGGSTTSGDTGAAPSAKGSSKSDSVGAENRTSRTTGESIAPPSDRSANPLKAATAAISDGPTVGGMLLWVLAIIAIVAGGLGFYGLRVRSGTRHVDQ